MEIYEPKGRAREYSPLALNYFKGCPHGCAYCYVEKMMTRFNPGYVHSDVSCDMDYGRLERSAKKFQGCGKQILLSFTGDPYCGIKPEATRNVLEVLNKYGHKVAILTKGGSRMLKDVDVFQKYGERIKIGASLTFLSPEDSKNWEPGAASPDDRIHSLRMIANEGIKTWASFEPVIDTEQSLELLKIVAGFVDHVKIGKINNYNGIDKKIDWAKFIFEAVRICRNKNLKFYIKKDLQIYNNGVYLSGSEIDEDYLNL